MKKKYIAETEALLQSQERWCMNACSRYIHRDPTKDTVWTLHGGDRVCSLIVYVKYNLLPVLCGEEHIPPPHFLRGIFGTIPIHSMQGRKGDMLIMEAAMEKIEIFAAENTDYDLMCIDHPPTGRYRSSGPANLIIRKPQFIDMNALVALQAAYEQEEVIPTASEFNPVVSRLNIERLFASEQMLVAELDGQLIGKINTNAIAFTRFQIGGVYVHPDYRGLGIAQRMAGEFVASLIAQGRGISLFVKKINPCAYHVYERIGFKVFGDYRISYY